MGEGTKAKLYSSASSIWNRRTTGWPCKTEKSELPSKVTTWRSSSPTKGSESPLPALAEATKLARISVCETNLKYIGLGLNLYADAEGEGDFPPDRMDYAWNVYGLSRDGVADAMAGRMGQGVLYPDYIFDARIFYCPEASVRYPEAWSFYGPWCWAANFPTLTNPIEWTGLQAGIRSGRLYAECNTILAPHYEPLSREIFANRAIVTDVFTLGVGFALHKTGVPVLRGNGSVFLYQDTVLDDMVGEFGIPLNSGTPAAWAWWDALTNSSSTP